MTLIAHLSDPHFGTEVGPVCAALRSDLLRHRPDLIVLTGDITQRARAAQFRAARAFLDGLAPTPVLAVPGNHDLPLFDLLTRFTEPYRLYRRYISPELNATWVNAELAVVGVNSTRPSRHKHGELTDQLVKDVARRIAVLDQPFKIVALHHPLAIVAASDRRNRARGAEQALGAWIEAGADLFLGGHIHLPYCIPVGRATRQAILMQAGTSVSRRCREPQPNSYNLILTEPDGTRAMRLEQRDYDRASDAFVRSARWEARPSAAGWSLQAGQPDEARPLRPADA